MQKPEYHILVCNSFRVSGEPQGICNKKDAPNLLALLEEEIVDRVLDAIVSATGCLKVCDRGPAMVIYPQNWWYGNVNEDNLEDIMDALEDGEPFEELMITE